MHKKASQKRYPSPSWFAYEQMMINQPDPTLRRKVGGVATAAFVDVLRNRGDNIHDWSLNPEEFYKKELAKVEANTETAYRQARSNQLPDHTEGPLNLGGVKDVDTQEVVASVVVEELVREIQADETRPQDIIHKLFLPSTYGIESRLGAEYIKEVTNLLNVSSRAPKSINAEDRRKEFHMVVNDLSTNVDRYNKPQRVPLNPLIESIMSKMYEMRRVALLADSALASGNSDNWLNEIDTFVKSDKSEKWLAEGDRSWGDLLEKAREEVKKIKNVDIADIDDSINRNDMLQELGRNGAVSCKMAADLLAYSSELASLAADASLDQQLQKTNSVIDQRLSMIANPETREVRDGYVEARRRFEEVVGVHPDAIRDRFTRIVNYGLGETNDLIRKSRKPLIINAESGQIVIDFHSTRSGLANVLPDLFKTNDATFPTINGRRVKWSDIDRILPMPPPIVVVDDMPLSDNIKGKIAHKRLQREVREATEQLLKAIVPWSKSNIKELIKEDEHVKQQGALIDTLRLREEIMSGATR